MIIKANQDTLSVVEDQTAYSGAKNYYQITFQFSSDWDSFSMKHVVFMRNENEVEDVIIPSDGVVDIPNAFLEYETALNIGCYGLDGDARRTTNLVKIIIADGSYKIGAQAMPTPDIFQQYLDQIAAYTAAIDFDSALKDVPAGGKTGQVLSKKSEDDYDTEWTDNAAASTLDDVDINNTSTDARYTGLSTQKSINEKISTDLNNTAADSHNHDATYLAISHGSQTNNPHNVTKIQIGLSNADNTADTDKPVSSAVQTALDAKLDIADTAVKTADFTLSLNEANLLVRCDSTGSITVTVPANATVAFPVNTEISVVQENTGSVAVAADTNVTILSKDSALSLAGQYAAATLKKIDTNTWYLIGGITS